MIKNLLDFRILFLLICFTIISASGQADDKNEQSQSLMLCSWNILGGGGNRVEGIAEWIRQQGCDLVALQELNGWTEARLGTESAAWGHRYASLMHTKLEGDHYNFGISSRLPFEVVAKQIDGFWHGLFHVRVPLQPSKNETAKAALDVFLTHLNPRSAADRRKEVRQIAAMTQGLGLFLIMGDLNSLSPLDRPYYDRSGVPVLLRSHADLQSKYMTEEGLVDYEPIQLLMDISHDLDYYGLDYDQAGGEWFQHSVPTPMNDDYMHATKLRIDYVFASELIFDHNVKSCGIVTSPELDHLSDHYPVVCHFELFYDFIEDLSH